MKMTKLLVFCGAFDHDSAGEMFWPPHIRMGSSAAFLVVSIPPSAKEAEVTVNGAAAACPSPGIPNKASEIEAAVKFHPSLVFISFDPLKIKISLPFGRDLGRGPIFGSIMT